MQPGTEPIASQGLRLAGRQQLRACSCFIPARCLSAQPVPHGYLCRQAAGRQRAARARCQGPLSPQGYKAACGLSAASCSVFTQRPPPSIALRSMRMGKRHSSLSSMAAIKDQKTLTTILPGLLPLLEKKLNVKLFW